MQFKVLLHYMELDRMWNWLKSNSIEYNFIDSDAKNYPDKKSFQTFLSWFGRNHSGDQTVIFLIDIPKPKHALLFKLVWGGR